MTPLSAELDVRSTPTPTHMRQGQNLGLQRRDTHQHRQFSILDYLIGRREVAQVARGRVFNPSGYRSDCCTRVATGLTAGIETA